MLVCLLLICLIIGSQHLPQALVLQIGGLSFLCFLLTSILSCLLANEFLQSFLEPADVCKSKLIAGLPETVDKSTTLVGLADAIINELDSSRQREKSIAEFSTDVLCCLNSERKFMAMNAQTETVLGHPVASLLATTLDSIVLSVDLQALVEFFNQARIGEGRTQECRIRTQSGRLVDLEWQCEWSKSLELYYCLARDISDRKENQRLKAEISAMITHDLRAPVAGISYFLEKLEKGLYGNISEAAQNDVEKAQEGTDKVLSLINRLMDAEKLEDGKMEADIKIIALSELYDDARSTLSGLAAQKSVSLDFPESTSLVFADYDQCNQVLCNLISNAIKYSPEGGKVEVQEKNVGISIVLSVSDQGQGIAEEFHAQVFDRFKSLNSDKATGLASSGLGLYIAKKLAELQGGSIGVKSIPGNGATFWFSLRRATEIDLAATEI